MDCSTPSSSAHGILQARILEWAVIPFSRGSSWSRDRTWVSHPAGRFFTVWATREAPTFGKIQFIFTSTYYAPGTFFFLTLLILIMMSGDNFWYPHFSDKETDAQKAPRLAWSHILAALVLITMRGTIKRVAAQACESESSFLHLLTLSHPIAHTHHQVMPTPPLEYFLTPSNPFSLSRFQSQPTIISQSCLTLTLQGLNFFSAKWG